MTAMTASQNSPAADVAARIHLIADLACTIARSCSFSEDPAWFWKLAEEEIDQCMVRLDAVDSSIEAAQTH